jgi:hypothetical protein
MGKKGMIGLLCCLFLCAPSLLVNAVDYETVDFIIITPASFVEELGPLVPHKQSHGIATQIITLDEIVSGTYFAVQGRDPAEQIKYFIKNAKETWATTHVMLVGGKDLMPARMTRTCFGNTTVIIYVDYFSDLYYADLYFSNGSFCSWDSNNDGVYADKNRSGFIDDVDLFPDVCVGRILTTTETEVQTVVTKIITYENSTAGQPWFNTLIVCGADDARSLLIETALPFLLKRVGVPVFEGEYLGNHAVRILSGFSAKKIYGSGLINPLTKALTIANINSAINEGAGFLMFNGHGSAECAILTNFPFLKHIWLPLPHRYNRSDVDALTNGDKLPVALFGGCNCGDFNASDCPIAWKFIAHENGGAIASIACTAGATMVLGSLCVNSFHGHMLMRIFSAYAEGTDCVGDLWCESIRNYLNDADAMALGDAFSLFNWRDILANHYVLEQWTLFGDPTLKIGGYP